MELEFALVKGDGERIAEAEKKLKRPSKNTPGKLV
jgi:hypothetical protein